MTAVESPTDRVLQVVRANPGDRLIIRVPSDTDVDTVEALQTALASLNPGVKFVILAADRDMQPEPEFLERACEVYFTAAQNSPTDGTTRAPWADQPDDVKATVRAAMWVLWECITNG